MGGFYRLAFSQDTLVGGMSSQQIDIYRYAFGQSGPGGPIVQWGNPDHWQEFTRASGDTVFRWDGNQYCILFDFGAQPGDSWITSTNPPSWADPMCGDTSWVQVVSTGTEVINGNTYRYIELDYVAGSPTYLGGHFNERFGGNAPFIFPGYATCDSMLIAELDMLTFKCFEDDQFLLYNPSGEDCEYLLTHLGLDQNEAAEIHVAPNPADAAIHVSGIKVGRYEIVDFKGTVVLRSDQLSDGNTVDVSMLSPGVYCLGIQYESTIRYARFVKK